MTSKSHWTRRDLALWGVLVAITGGINLVLLGAHSSSWNGRMSMGLASVGGGLFGGWLLAVSRLLITPRGSTLHEVGVAAVAAGPASLLMGLGLLLSSRRSLAPAGVLVPGLATVWTPVLVGCLATLAWRLRRQAAQSDDT